MDPTKLATLLLASVMAAGGIVTIWSATLTQKALPEEGNESQELCSLAMFGIYSGDYDKNSKSLYLVLQNKKSVDLELKNLYLFYPENVMKTILLNESLKANVLRSINITEVDDGFKKGVIKTNCPDVSIEFTYSDVGGIQVRVPLQIPLIQEIKKLFKIDI